MTHPDGRLEVVLGRSNVWMRSDRAQRKTEPAQPMTDTPEERIREIARAVARIADNLELPQTADRMRRIANGQ